MFVKGKVYKTVSGKPAKVLWVAPQTAKLSGFMCVLHDAYTQDECVLLHLTETGAYFEGSREDDLTEELYND